MEGSWEGRGRNFGVSPVGLVESFCKYGKLGVLRSLKCFRPLGNIRKLRASD